MEQNIKIYSHREVQALVKYGAVSIYNKVKADRFPPSNSESGCAKTWDSQDIKMYLRWRIKYPKNSKWSDFINESKIVQKQKLGLE